MPKSISLNNVTTTTYGNITTTLKKTEAFPICADLGYNNGVPSFYTHPATEYWLIHVFSPGNGDAIPNYTFSQIKLYYIGA